MTAQVELTTGTGAGLGRAVAAHLADAGWRLAIVSHFATRLEGVGPADVLRIEPMVPRLTAYAPWSRGALRRSRCRPRWSIAPAAMITPLHRTSEAAYRACLGANVDTAFFSLAAFVEALRSAQRSGAAVLVCSVVGHIGVASHGAISMAKAAVAGLVRAAAATYAPSRIRGNVVSPAFMHTPATASIFASDAGREGVTRQYPLGGIGSLDEIAHAIAWLIAAAAARITGQVLPIDGGFTAVRPLVK